MATAFASAILVEAVVQTPIGSNPSPAPCCVAGHTNGIGTVGGFELWKLGVLQRRVNMANLTPNQSSSAAFTGPQPGFFINSHNSGSGCGTGLGDGILQWAVPQGVATLFTMDATSQATAWDLIQFNMGDSTGCPIRVTILDTNGAPMSAVSAGGVWSRAQFGLFFTAPQFVQLVVPSDYVFGAYLASRTEAAPISDYFEFLSPLPPPPPPVLENASAPGGGFRYGRHKQVSFLPVPLLPIVNVVEVDSNVS